MLKKRVCYFSLVILSFVLMLASCQKAEIKWRGEQKLVAQLYRQYKEEVSLAYNNFDDKRIVDLQKGYARAYFDHYRQHVIFAKDRTLDYLINGKAVSTATKEVTGYPSDILLSDKYQVAVEILDVRPEMMENNAFNGARSRIIDLNTGKQVTVPGLLFNGMMLVGNYAYGFTFDNASNQIFDMINLETMEHKRITKATDKISFIYQAGNRAYVQIASLETAFELSGLELIEKPELYNPVLPNFEHGTQILKDIAPKGSAEHWYIESPSMEENIKSVRFFRFHADGTMDENTVALGRDDIIQIMDVANYGQDGFALLFMTKDEQDEFHAMVRTLDLQGQQMKQEEITDLLQGDIGRFTYLDYIG